MDERIVMRRVLQLHSGEEYVRCSDEIKLEAELILIDNVVMKNRDHPVQTQEAIDENVEQAPELSVPELLAGIHQWGVDRNIIGGAKSQSQYLKLAEEFSEIVDGTEKYDQEEVKDGIGDTIVVLSMIAGIEQLEVRLPPYPATHIEVSLWDTTNCHLEGLKLLGKIGTAIAKSNSRQLQYLIDRMIYIVDIRARMDIMDLRMCMEKAYNTIKDRKGVVYEGVFIRSTDPSYVGICEKLGKQP